MASRLDTGCAPLHVDPSEPLTDGLNSRSDPSVPLLLRVEEAARLLAIGHSKIFELIISGDIPSLTIGRARRIPLAALKEWVAARTATQATERPAGLGHRAEPIPPRSNDGW